MSNGKKRKQRTSEHETSPLQVPGFFLDRVTQIPSGSATLITSLGESEGDSFLVPFVDLSLFEKVSLEGEAEPQTGEAFGRIVTLENAVYLMTILSSELVAVFSDYETMASEKLGPEPSRFKAISGYLDSTRESLEVIQQTLSRLGTTEPAVAETV